MPTTHESIKTCRGLRFTRRGGSALLFFKPDGASPMLIATFYKLHGYAGASFLCQNENFSRARITFRARFTTINEYARYFWLGKIVSCAPRKDWTPTNGCVQQKKLSKRLFF